MGWAPLFTRHYGIIGQVFTIHIVSGLSFDNHNLAVIKALAMQKFHSMKEPYLELLNRVVDSQAYMLATNDVMIVSAITMVVLIIILFWVNVSPEEIRTRGVHVGH